MEAVLSEKMQNLHALFRSLGRVAVAYSGGVDSAFLLKAAHDALGSENVLALTAVSASMPAYVRAAAEELARQIGAPLMWIESHEDQDERYLANPANRCYFCKTNVYDELIPAAEQAGFSYLADGTNADDADDYRPGRRAAREHGVRSPLQELGFTKAEIRQASHELGLANWDAPAAPCLSSRIPYGTRITPEILDQIARAELALRTRGFREVRVRHHDKVARIEVPPADFDRLLDQRTEIVAALREAGYQYISLDLTGLRSGSLNEVLLVHGRGQAA
ncbi:MAG: hypothetical protein BWY52_00703 [Chloroflexi bacterium ADurb.Bin325]|nr:MAG: hypothetical protein BWY52_00703 [Chloroflexi bacterium ADurb.Bin325]